MKYKKRILFSVFIWCFLQFHMKRKIKQQKYNSLIHKKLNKIFQDLWNGKDLSNDIKEFQNNKQCLN